jgi:uncharacterized protein YodC (DUF2158 family)
MTKRYSPLILVGKVEEFHNSIEPPLSLGAVIRLNSGGPGMVVVDLNESGDEIVASWYDASGAGQEITLPRACVHRVRHGGG